MVILVVNSRLTDNIPGTHFLASFPGPVQLVGRAWEQGYLFSKTWQCTYVVVVNEMPVMSMVCVWNATSNNSLGVNTQVTAVWCDITACWWMGHT